MKRFLLLLFIIVSPAFVFSQTYTPITITGFNHDVIAEGTGGSSLDITTKEMDALVPSNYIICTKQFAAANAIPSNYGIPDNGTITTGSRTYQLTNLGPGTGLNNNVLYLFQNETGILTFSTPAAYSAISLLGTATEGQTTINIKVNYTDGTTQFFNGKTYDDWVGGAAPILQGFGRVKRQNGPFLAGTYEKAPTDPRLYSIDLVVSCSKIISSVTVSNVSTGGASSNRAFVFAISGSQTSIPQPPVVPGVSICPNNSATLSVQSPSSVFTYKWYNAATGGTSFFTGTSYTTPVLTATTTYYVQAGNSAGCVSTRVPVTVTVDTPVAQPVVPTINICSGQSAVLTISNPQTGVTYDWFTSSAGGTPFFTGTSYTTPVLTGSVTYYIKSTSAAGCAGTVLATATVNLAPDAAAPLLSNVQICSGNSATLSVNNPDPALTYSWYVASSGVTPFFTGTAYTTPVLTAPITYYVESKNAGGCISATRTAVTVSILPDPASPVINNATVCKGQSATLSISNADPAITYSWYTSTGSTTPVFVGTTFTTPVLTSSVTYYVQASSAAGCKSSFTTVTVTMSSALSNPVVPGITICNGDAGLISVISPVVGYIYSWYNNSSGGTSTSTGPTYQTPLLSSNTTYYVQAANGSGCVSGLSPVTVTVIPTLQLPSASAVTVCYNNSATITINAPQAGLTYNWYSSATGGSLIFTGLTYTTGALTTTTNYFIEAVNSNGCKSDRAQVTVTVTPDITAPLVSPVTVCINQSATLTIPNPGTGLTYRWYLTNTSVTPVATGTSYTTPVLANSTTYYVQAISSAGCKSSLGTATANVLPAAPVPSVLPVTLCIGQSTSLTITNPQAGLTYTWYSSSSGGSAIATGTVYTTSPITATTTFYVEAQTAGGCKSPSRAPAVVNILPALPPPVVSLDTICPDQAGVLTVVNPQAGFTYHWYNVQTGGSVVSTDTIFVTPVLTSSATYYVDAQNGGGCLSLRTPATVTIKTAPTASFGVVRREGCDPLDVTFSNTSRNATSYFWTLGDGSTSSDRNPNRIYHTGSYSITLIATGNGCSDTLSKTDIIKVVSPPVADFSTYPGTSTSVELRFASYLFTNTSRFANRYTWNFGDGGSSTFQSPTHRFTQTGSYKVTLYASNSYGCVDSVSKQFYKIIPDSTMNIPNAFSPNNDGINDTWIIRGISGYTNAIVSIYNRWGSLVYVSNGIYKPWNGTYNGSPLSTSTYYYVIQLSTVDKPIVGWLLLVK